MDKMSQVLLSNGCRVVFQPAAGDDVRCVWCSHVIEADTARLRFEPTTGDGTVDCCFDCVTSLQEALDQFEPEERHEVIRPKRRNGVWRPRRGASVQYAAFPEPDGMQCLVCGADVTGGDSHFIARTDDETAAAHHQCLVHHGERPVFSSLLQLGGAEQSTVSYGGVSKQDAKKTCLGCGEKLVPTEPHFLLFHGQTAVVCHTGCWPSVSDTLEHRLWDVAAEHGTTLLGDLL